MEFVENRAYLTQGLWKNYAKSHGLGEEEAARILRYEKFKKVAFSRAEKSDSVKIAIAHHLEDNTETILFQMQEEQELTVCVE